MSSEARISDLQDHRNRLKRWASDTGSDAALAIVNDLVEILAAARTIVTAIEKLPNEDREFSGKRLIEIQTWLYEELLDHATSLRVPLQEAVDDAYRDK